MCVLFVAVTRIPRVCAVTTAVVDGQNVWWFTKQKTRAIHCSFFRLQTAQAGDLPVMRYYLADGYLLICM